MEKEKQTSETKKETIDFTKPHPLLNFDGVKRFKSVWRAIRRGKASIIGVVYPNRPFNNRKPTRGRQFNEEKKKVYADLQQRRVQQ